jgi:hypothetical protein
VEKVCPEGYACNSATGRCVKIGGRVHTAMLKAASKGKVKASALRTSPTNILKNASNALPLDILEKILGKIEFILPTLSETLLMATWKKKRRQAVASSVDIKENNNPSDVTIKYHYNVTKLDTSYTVRYYVDEEYLRSIEPFIWNDPFEYVFYAKSETALKWKELQASTSADMMFCEAMRRYTTNVVNGFSPEIPEQLKAHSPLAKRFYDEMKRRSSAISDNNGTIAGPLDRQAAIEIKAAKAYANINSLGNILWVNISESNNGGKELCELLFDMSLIVNNDNMVYMISNHLAYKCGEEIRRANALQLKPFSKDTEEIKRLIKKHKLGDLMMSK